MIMVDIQSISTGLQLGDDGIWYSTDAQMHRCTDAQMHRCTDAQTKDISYPSEGHDACFAVEDNSFWFRHRNNCITAVVASYPPGNNDTIFDIGGGNGFVSLKLADSGFNVALVEPGRAGASNAKRRGLSNVICATTDTAKFKQHSLPAVGLFDVIEHIDDDLAFLKSIRELMKKNAPLYVTVPSYSFLWSAEDVFAGHFRRYNLDGISNVLQLAGFQVEFSSCIFRFLPVPVFLLRTLPYKLGLSKTKRGTSSTISRDHAVKGGIMVNILDSILQSEVKNLNNRKAMSFGGSCLIVAKKP